MRKNQKSFGSEKLLSFKEAGSFASLTSYELLANIKDGMPYIRRGGRYHFKRQSLTEWLSDNNENYNAF